MDAAKQHERRRLRIIIIDCVKVEVARWPSQGWVPRGPGLVRTVSVDIKQHLKTPLEERREIVACPHCY